MPSSLWEAHLQFELLTRLFMKKGLILTLQGEEITTNRDSKVPSTAKFSENEANNRLPNLR